MIGEALLIATTKTTEIMIAMMMIGKEIGDTMIIGMIGEDRRDTMTIDMAPIDEGPTAMMTANTTMTGGETGIINSK
jgi:hypothetical protein